MNATYTRDQAMELLGIKSRNALKHLAKRYPEAFVLVKQGSSRFPRYDKEVLERFARIRASLKGKFH